MVQCPPSLPSPPFKAGLRASWLSAVAALAVAGCHLLGGHGDYADTGGGETPTSSTGGGAGGTGNGGNAAGGVSDGGAGGSGGQGGVGACADVVLPSEVGTQSVVFSPPQTVDAIALTVTDAIGSQSVNVTPVNIAPPGPYTFDAELVRGTYDYHFDGDNISPFVCRGTAFPAPCSLPQHCATTASGDPLLSVHACVFSENPPTNGQCTNVDLVGAGGICEPSSVWQQTTTASLSAGAAESVHDQVVANQGHTFIVGVRRIGVESDTADQAFFVSKLSPAGDIVAEALLPLALTTRGYQGVAAPFSLTPRESSIAIADTGQDLALVLSTNTGLAAPWSLDLGGRCTVMRLDYDLAATGANPVAISAVGPAPFGAQCGLPAHAPGALMNEDKVALPARIDDVLVYGDALLVAVSHAADDYRGTTSGITASKNVPGSTFSRGVARKVPPFVFGFALVDQSTDVIVSMAEEPTGPGAAAGYGHGSAFTSLAVQTTGNVVPTLLIAGERRSMALGPDPTSGVACTNLMRFRGANTVDLATGATTCGSANDTEQNDTVTAFALRLDLASGNVEPNPAVLTVAPENVQRPIILDALADDKVVMIHATAIGRPRAVMLNQGLQNYCGQSPEESASFSLEPVNPGAGDFIRVDSAFLTPTNPARLVIGGVVKGGASFRFANSSHPDIPFVEGALFEQFFSAAITLDNSENGADAGFSGLARVVTFPSTQGAKKRMAAVSWSPLHQAVVFAGEFSGDMWGGAGQISATSRRGVAVQLAP